MGSVGARLLPALRGLVGALPAPLEKGLKRRAREARVRYVRWRDDVGIADLGPFLRDLGVREGDLLFVHSSYDAFWGFRDASPLEVIRVLQELVGPSGTLAMPTHASGGSAVDYAARGITFDVRRTPSRMGLLTELFRRMPGVVRSVHPTHSVAAWGAKAEAFVAGHHRAGTPCGEGSPYMRLLTENGRILLLGTSYLAMSFYHTVDELLENQLPFTPFLDEVFHLESKDREGNVHETRTRLFDPAAAEGRKRFEERLPHVMKESGTWREGRVGTVSAILLDAGDVLEALRRAALS